VRRNLRAAFDECLRCLEAGQATLEECLDRHPEHAVELRALLETVSEIRQIGSPAAGAAAIATGRRRMLEALAGRERRQVVGASASSSTLFRPTLSRLADLLTGRRAWVLGASLASAAALVMCVVAAYSVGAWLGVSVERSATLEQVQGLVESLPAGADSWQAVSSGHRVEAGDRLRTGSTGGATLVFFDGSTVDLAAGTEVTAARMSARRAGGGRVIVITQRVGHTASLVQHLPDAASRFEVETPSAVAVVRGTEFTLDVEDDGTTHVTVSAGIVDVAAQQVTVEVESGQGTTVLPEQPPAPASQVADPEGMPTHVPPGLTKTPQPPGLTKTPQPPGRSKPPKSTKTPRVTKTPRPTRTPRATKIKTGKGPKANTSRP
jgi:ferric-dicitrate binding protein FerR (iron transport regulator)